MEVFEEFPSTKPKPALLVAHLSPLQPRFYSISSSPLAHPKEIHLTVAVVTYRTQRKTIIIIIFFLNFLSFYLKKIFLMFSEGSGPYHYGVCSNYLNDIKLGEDVYVFIRRFV